jgi:hypothetical protein
MNKNEIIEELYKSGWIEDTVKKNNVHDYDIEEAMGWYLVHLCEKQELEDMYNNGGMKRIKRYLTKDIDLFLFSTGTQLYKWEIKKSPANISKKASEYGYRFVEEKGVIDSGSNKKNSEPMTYIYQELDPFVPKPKPKPVIKGKRKYTKKSDKWNNWNSSRYTK